MPTRSAPRATARRHGGRPDEPASGARPLLAVTDAHRAYGGVRALRGANFAVTRPGVVHGLLGENGSGKSTLLGILSGQHQPDAGTVELDGRPIRFHRPADALGHGIAMVSQETALAPQLSVAENILMGPRIVRGAAGIRWTATRRKAAQVLDQLHADFGVEAVCAGLRTDQQQLVEIARALSCDARIIIMDEPTSSLTDDQSGALFELIRRLTGQGISVVFVSHRFAEILALTDELTVLRDGVTVLQGETRDHSQEALVEAMLGRPAEAGGGAAPRAPGVAGTRSAGAGAPLLATAGLTLDGHFRDVDLEVGPGEIVGLAGLVGAGRGALLRTLFGITAPTAGRIDVGGEPVTVSGPRDAIALGIGYLPPDRKVEGLMQSRPVRENLAVVATSRRGRLARPSWRAEDHEVAVLAEQMRFSAPPDVPVSRLSGGNQQKVALAKWLLVDSRILLLDEPTRGVDVLAKSEIQRNLRRAAGEGRGILVSSSENPELLDLCDRILVMFRGAVVAELDAGQASEHRITRLAGGTL